MKSNRINRRAFCLGLAALLAASVLAGCGGGGGGTGTPGPDGTSGVSGFALLSSEGGPVRPSAPPPTPSPYAGTTLAVEPSGGGSPVAQVKTDAKGAFKVSLDPGAYQLVPVPTNLEQLSSIVGQPQSFTVTAHQFTTVSVAYFQELP